MSFKTIFYGIALRFPQLNYFYVYFHSNNSLGKGYILFLDINRKITIKK